MEIPKSEEWYWQILIAILMLTGILDKLEPLIEKAKSIYFKLKEFRKRKEK